MKNRRLGKFRFRDYCISWISIVLLLLFSIASSVLELPLLCVIFPLVYAMIWFVAILVPHCEQFSISSDSITVFFGRDIKTICLPSELTIVVSYADVCPPLTMRTAVGNETHILKNKFAVSILQGISVNVALETLHRNRVQKYTSSSIRTAFDDYHYIYSFVCNQSLFDTLIAGRKCLLIVPESLSKIISFESSIENMTIDYGY
jgi:hypothetical protein